MGKRNCKKRFNFVYRSEIKGFDIFLKLILEMINLQLPNIVGSNFPTYEENFIKILLLSTAFKNVYQGR